MFWNRRYEPAVSARDADVKEALGSDGLATESFNAALLHEPWTIQNQSNKPFQVFTPFWRHCLAKLAHPEPLPAAKNLHFGEISPRQVWHGLRQMTSKRGLPVEHWRASQFLAETGWREFAHHLLFHSPHTPTEALREDFKNFPWRKDAAWLRAWQKGRTGYPIVDAGMRELWTTGWMHNRVRMTVTSFLVKDLLLPWQEGAR